MPHSSKRHPWLNNTKQRKELRRVYHFDTPPQAMLKESTKRRRTYVQNGCSRWLLTIISLPPKLPWVWILAMFVLYKVSRAMTIFGTSHDQNIKTVTTQTAYMHVILIKTMPTVKEPSGSKSSSWVRWDTRHMTSENIYDVIAFFNNRSMLRIWHYFCNMWAFFALNIFWSCEFPDRAMTLKVDPGQSRSQSPQAFSTAVGRLERLWDNGIDVH